MRLLLLLLLAAAPALALAQPPVVLRLTLVHFEGGAWQAREVTELAAQAVKILGQCAIVPGDLELVRAEVGPRFRTFHTPTSRELARKLRPRAPAVYFVDRTRQRPAFDAEAIGRGNSRTRPELADSVWLVRDARDPALALAHELAHMLMDSGEHSDEPGNLMRDETAPGNTRLSAAQCARLRDTGLANGLLDTR
ncbi:MAG: hypothetical protein WBL29_02300 [Burkholderiales bacterium]